MSDFASSVRPASDAVAVSTAPVPPTFVARRPGALFTSEVQFQGPAALYRRVVELGDTSTGRSFFELVRGTCKNRWPDEFWEDCADMAELVNEMEERTVTWPAKWKANYIAEGRAKGRTEGRAEGLTEGRAKGRTEGRAEGRAEGHAEGRAEGRVGLLVSMARERFGETVASTISALLGSVRTESALEQVGKWLVTCETGDALIGKIRQM